MHKEGHIKGKMKESRQSLILNYLQELKKQVKHYFGNVDTISAGWTLKELKTATRMTY